MPWDYKKFGTPVDPIRQSALNDIASQNGCAKRYQFDRNETEKRELTHWKPVVGNVVHRVIERALTRTWPQLQAAFSRDADAGCTNLRASIARAYREEMTSQSAVEWYEDSPQDAEMDACEMVFGALRTTVERASAIVGCEVPFGLDIAGFAVTGTIDLIYLDHDGRVGIADWKTGERKLDQILLDHGYQAAIYTEAVRCGVWWPGSSWPENTPDVSDASRKDPVMHIVHLRDFVPYRRATKTAKVGDLRGPGWYVSKRTEADTARLSVSLRTVVGTVRMGRFVEQLGEQCRRCRHRGPCLTEGGGPTKQELRQLELLELAD